MIIENIVANEDQGKKMDEAIKNAKTDQEKMDLAMKYSQELQQKMMAGGGPMSTLPKLVTSVPNATLDPMKAMGGKLNGNIKFDDLFVVAYDKILDLQGNRWKTEVRSRKSEEFSLRSLDFGLLTSDSRLIQNKLFSIPKF